MNTGLNYKKIWVVVGRTGKIVFDRDGFMLAGKTKRAVEQLLYNTYCEGALDNPFVKKYGRDPSSDDILEYYKYKIVRGTVFTNKKEKEKK